MNYLKEQKYLIIICGPTGIGKTSVGIELAKYFDSVIISADSRQIYKEMTIGTAVPSKETQSGILHYFLQTHSIHESYNASMFETEVNEFLSDYYKNNQVAIMAGGSGLYADAVCNGIDDIPTINQPIRNKWHLIYIEKGLEYLQQKVRETDPEYFKVVDKNNPKRLQKAMEVFEMSGKPYSSFLTKTNKKRNFIPLKIALNTDREELYKRINHRVDKMMESGLLDEAKSLYPFKNLRPLNTVGYKELFDYLEGKLSLNEATDQIKNHSRAYARRQITWFRKDKSISWFEPDASGDIIRYIEEQIKI
jgi:tRNA dimethylallyltransferase